MSSRGRSLRWGCIQALLWCLLCLVVPSQALAQGSEGWAFNLGVFDVIDSDKATEGGLEYRFRPFELWTLELTPMVGFSATDEGNYWGYGGLRYDLELGSKWVMTPHFSISLYEQGDGKDLGGVVEFRSGLDIAYRFEGGSRLGLSFYHLSNARIYELNPGSESLVLVYSLGR